MPYFCCTEIRTRLFEPIMPTLTIFKIMQYFNYLITTLEDCRRHLKLYYRTLSCGCLLIFPALHILQ